MGCEVVGSGNRGVGVGRRGGETWLCVRMQDCLRGLRLLGCYMYMVGVVFGKRDCFKREGVRGEGVES